MVRCHWDITQLWHPLADDGSNAFNQCFLLHWLEVVVVVCGVWALYDGYRLAHRQLHGRLVAKNLGLVFYIRVAMVVGVGVLWFKLVPSVSLVILLVLTPIHIIEPVVLVIPRDVLLVFWPLITVLETAMAYQQLTHLPLFNDVYPRYMFGLVVASMLIFSLEYYWWRPLSQLVLDYANNDALRPLLQLPNLVDRLTFCWMNPMILALYKLQLLNKAELPNYSPESLSCRDTGSQFRKLFQSGKSDWQFVVVLMKAFGITALILFAFELVSKLLNFVQPQLLRLLIAFFDGGHPFIYGVLVCIAMFALTFFQTFVFNEYFMKNLKLGLDVRLALTANIYDKALKLDKSDGNELLALGDIINLMLIDVNRLQNFVMDMLALILAPTDIALCVALLWPLLGGTATLAGVGTLAVLVPFNLVVVKYTRLLSKKQMKIKDKRTKLINDLLLSIKLIKLFAWEQPLGDEIDEVRNQEELANLRHIRLVWQGVSFIWNLIPFLVLFVLFATFTYVEKQPLTPDIVFPSLVLFNLLSSPLLQIPGVLTAAVEAAVTVQRLNKFFSQRETSTAVSELGTKQVAVLINNGTFGWSREKPVLFDINFATTSGSLHCIVGRVGLGKLSLLLAILGLMDASPELKVRVYGKIAYCAQLPWIMNALVKENILFGHRFDEDYYRLVLRACQLEPDLVHLPDGDATQVGEKGVLLLGGQKARLALARAVYACADVYLLDDVLLAVDSHVGKRIIDEVVMGLLKGRTIIMATNALLVLPYADKVSLLDNGKLVETRARDLSSLDTPLISQLVGEYLSPPPPSLSLTLTPSLPGLPDLNKIQVLRRALVELFRWDPLARLISTTDVPLVEKSAKGKVKWGVYMAYARACGFTGTIVWFIIVVGAQILSVALNYWLKDWTDRNQRQGNNGNIVHFLAGYAALGVGLVVLQLALLVLAQVGLFIRALRTIHHDMMQGVLYLPMQFFELNPIGRIMNRFTLDVGKIDLGIPQTMLGFIRRLVVTVFTLGVVGVAMPAYIIAIVVLLVIYLYYEVQYVLLLRELKRLVSVLRLPIYAHLGELLTGRDTICAYGQMDRFRFINYANIDFNIKAVYMLRLINRWLYFRLQVIGLMAVLCATGLAIATTLTAHPLLPAMAGFVMTYALQVTTSLKLVVRMLAEVETNVVAVERCLEYAQLPLEPRDGEQARLTWPESGTVAFDHYLTRYRPELDLVLRDVTLKIGAGEKIGVVGRTGAGKSSLLLAIFRILEATGGSISIDDSCIADLRLDTLRHRLAIIPQDSQLVAGTVRHNLDPFGYYTDDEIWRALELAHLKPVVEQLDDKLLHMVSEGGNNFSHGQRQLISLARVILKMKANTLKILVLDEATASVDVETDRIIQQTIRSQFADKTIITIAHRLDTVMDSDKILLLDHGEVKEFDTPKNLLEKGGIFAELCKQGDYDISSNNDST